MTAKDLSRFSESKLLLWLQQAHQHVRREIIRRYKRSGYRVTTEQVAVVTYLFRHKNCSQNELAEGLEEDKPSISRLVAGLEKHGYVKRVAIDKRTNSVSLSPTGEVMFKTLAPISSMVSSQLLNDVPDKDVATVLRVLRILADRS